MNENEDIIPKREIKEKLPGIFATFPNMPGLKQCINIPQLSTSSGSSDPELKSSDQEQKTEDHTDDPVISPAELGFIPKSNWSKQSLSLSKLRRIYFQKRKGNARQFDYKLYNALLITKRHPAMYQRIGAIWVTNDVIKINSEIFANLIGINTIQGGLFHKQGNFPRHGFIQVYKNSSSELFMNPDCAEVDDHHIRLFIDKFRRFSREKEFVVIEDVSLI